MLVRYVYLAITSVLLLSLLSVALTNNQSVHLSTLAGGSDLSFGLCLLIGVIIGALFAFALGQIMVRKVESQKRKLEWDAQDAKLVAEVKSDREKQLEAKIATLEVALKSALKK